MDTAKRLADLLSERGMSGNELASLSGVSQTMISALLRDKHAPSIRTLDLLCQALGISLEEFFRDMNKAPSDEEGANDIMLLLRDAGIVKDGETVNHAQAKALLELIKANSDFIQARVEQIEEQDV